MFILKISHIFPNTFKYFSGINFQFENFESANLLTHDAFKVAKSIPLTQIHDHFPSWLSTDFSGEVKCQNL